MRGRLTGEGDDRGEQGDREGRPLLWMGMGRTMGGGRGTP